MSCTHVMCTYICIWNDWPGSMPIGIWQLSTRPFPFIWIVWPPCMPFGTITDIVWGCAAVCWIGCPTWIGCCIPRCICCCTGTTTVDEYCCGVAVVVIVAFCGRMKHSRSPPWKSLTSIPLLFQSANRFTSLVLASWSMLQQWQQQFPQKVSTAQTTDIQGQQITICSTDFCQVSFSSWFTSVIFSLYSFFETKAANLWS